MPAMRASSATFILFGLFAPVFQFFGELAHDFRNLLQPVVNFPVDGALRITSILLKIARINSRKDFKAFLDRGDGPDVELAFGDCVYYFLVKHQVADVFMRNHDALFACESFGFADVEKALDLIVHSPYRLDLTPL